MKEGIHPNYEQTTIRCSKCHPFYTGKQKMVDTGGRVSRFNKKFGLDK